MRLLLACVAGMAITAALLGVAVVRRRAGSERPVPVYWLGLFSAALWFPGYLAADAARSRGKMWTEASLGDLAIALPMLAGELGFAALLASIPARL